MRQAQNILVGSVLALAAFNCYNAHHIKVQSEQFKDRLDLLEARFHDTNQKTHIAFELALLNKHTAQDVSAEIKSLMLMNAEQPRTVQRHKGF